MIHQLTKLLKIVLPIILAGILFYGVALAQTGATFTYQGSLVLNGEAVDDTCDFKFSLFDDATTGSQIGSAQTVNNQTVSDGLFSVDLDFGAGAFDGSVRYLEIELQCSGDSSFSTLTPRQPVYAAPQAMYAAQVPWSGLTGLSCATNQIVKWNGTAWDCANPGSANTYTAGDGLTLTGTEFSVDYTAVATTAHTHDDRYWQLGGNSGLTNSNFIGTTDNISLTLKVSDTVAIRIAPGSGTPNIIGGDVANTIPDTAKGSVIAGGGDSSEDDGQHTISANFGAIGGGYLNQVQADFGVIAGGGPNGVGSGGLYGAVGGGYFNNVNGQYSVVSGGSANNAGGDYAAVPGGSANTAGGDYSFAAGRRAQANHNGAFVWADSTNADFSSTAADQFLVRAGNGLTFTLNTDSAWRATPGDNSGTANLIGGYSGNAVSSTVEGAFIGGGGDVDTANRVTGDFGVVVGGQGNVSDGTNAVVGGEDNRAGGQFSFIGGGEANTSTGYNAVIGGGKENEIALSFPGHSIVGGGWKNSVNSSLSVIGGGYGNSATGGDDAPAATIGGGYQNLVSADYATIGGGYTNTVSADYGVIGGGQDNLASGKHSAIGGGYTNTVSADYGVIAGGQSNQAGADYATIGGGQSNVATATHTFVGGGNDNAATGDYATVGGGYKNAVTARGGAIAGGELNSASLGAAVGGGNRNQATSTGATVSGGYLNEASSTYAVIGGGYDNTATESSTTIGGGQENVAQGAYSTIPGGYGAITTRYGQMAYASGYFSTAGDAQAGLYVLRNETSDGTPTELFLDGSAQRLIVPPSHTVAFDITITARSDNDKSAGYRVEGVIESDTSATSFIGTPTVTTLGEDDAAWDAAVIADNTNNALSIQVTGNSGDSIGWVAVVHTAEVIY